MWAHSYQGGGLTSERPLGWPGAVEVILLGTRQWWRLAIVRIRIWPRQRLPGSLHWLWLVGQVPGHIGGRPRSANPSSER